MSEEEKSRNPNPKTPKLKSSQKKTKKQIFEEKFGEFNDMPYAKLKSGGRVTLKKGGTVAKGCGAVMSDRRKKTKYF